MSPKTSYTKVRVMSRQSQILLQDGTASAVGQPSPQLASIVCSGFTEQQRPRIGQSYFILATDPENNDWEWEMRCVISGTTSAFRNVYFAGADLPESTPMLASQTLYRNNRSTLISNIRVNLNQQPDALALEGLMGRLVEDVDGTHILVSGYQARAYGPGPVTGSIYRVTYKLAEDQEIIHTAQFIGHTSQEQRYVFTKV